MRRFLMPTTTRVTLAGREGACSLAREAVGQKLSGSRGSSQAAHQLLWRMQNLPKGLCTWAVSGQRQEDGALDPSRKVSRMSSFYGLRPVQVHGAGGKDGGKGHSGDPHPGVPGATCLEDSQGRRMGIRLCPRNFSHLRCEFGPGIPSL